MSPGVETASGLFVNHRGEVLLGLRAAWKSAWPGAWDCIGGHLEPGETPEDALIREVREEVGLLPTRYALLASAPETRPDLHGPAIHHIYAVTAWSGGDPRNLGDEHDELRWFSEVELSTLSNLAGMGYRHLARQAASLRPR